MAEAAFFNNLAFPNFFFDPNKKKKVLIFNAIVNVMADW